MQELQTWARAGGTVQARGERWRVVAADTFDGCAVVTLRGVGDTNFGQITRLIAPFDAIQPIIDNRSRRYTSRHGAVRAAARALSTAHEWTTCWTAAGARIDLREWQLQPARAVLAGATRLLLADEVGLGKTIQAALIISELMARGCAQRALVLTPASLREQWAAELSERFTLPASIFDHAFLRAVTGALPPGVNPWSTATVIVSSIDLVKRPEIRAAVDGVAIDILVVDEAHHLAPGTDRAAAVSALAARVPWVVLATATPHSGVDEAYAFLRALGATGAGDEIVMFRRRTSDVHPSPRQRSRVLAVAPGTLERELLDATLAYARALWRVAGSERSGAGLVGSVVARRAASCAESVRRTLERRRALLGGECVEATQTGLPWDEGEIADAPEADDVLSAEGFADRAAEAALLDRLVILAAGAAAESSKVAAIERLLRRTNETAIVFSEYRDSVEWVAARLSRVAPLALLHGGLSAQSRQESLQAFTSGRARVLVATDAAGEGLNLQARCRFVINLELPWNPLRLDQRVGRVARIGQTRIVHALHLVHRGSFEDDVLARLQRRRSRAESAIIQTAFAGGACNGEEAASRTFSLLLSRGRSHPQRRDGTALGLRTRRRPQSRALLFVYECDFADAGSRVVQRVLIPVRVECDRGCAWNARTTAAIEADPRMRHALQQALDQRQHDAQAQVGLFRTSVERRITALVAMLDRPPEQRLFQASLFDRKAEQQAHSQRTARDAWREHLTRLLRTLEGSERLSASRVRLVAVWSER